jgi:site-specific DNA recombinase
MSGEPGDPDAERWQAEIEQSLQQLEDLAAMYGRREIGLTEWQAARTPIERRVTDAKKQLGQLTRTTALAGQIGNSAELRERWASLPLTRQQAIVAAVLDHLIVAPGRPGYNKFDPGRFTPVWRA